VSFFNAQKTNTCICSGINLLLFCGLTRVLYSVLCVVLSFLSLVSSLIAGGAAQADIGVLVVSARKNEFEQGFDRGGQTREHAMLALTLGISKLVVLVNKMDTCDWSEERFKQIRKNLGPFLRRIGYKVKRDVSWICCSGLQGDNIKDRVAEDVAPWMPDKRSLLECLDSLDIAKGRDANGPLRIPILDKYANRGTWVMGKGTCLSCFDS